MGSKQFPAANAITVALPKRNVSIDMQLTSLGNDSDWETRTEVTSKYKHKADRRHHPPPLGSVAGGNHAKTKAPTNKSLLFLYI